MNELQKMNVLHTGKLIALKRIENHDDFLKFANKNGVTPWGSDTVDDFLEGTDGTDITEYTYPVMLCEPDSTFFRYVLYKNVIYQFVNYKRWRYVSRVRDWVKNIDGTIDFTIGFINLSTHFEDELEKTLDELIGLLNREDDHDD